MWEIFSKGDTPYAGMSNSRAREKIDTGNLSFCYLGYLNLKILGGLYGDNCFHNHLKKSCRISTMLPC